MLSYQHAYHAGCRADVHKHAALAALLARLTEKPKPLSYMETHAGRGRYDLHAPEALKTGEAKQGIEAALKAKAIPAEHPYMRAIAGCRARHGGAAYPGSPEIARLTLRLEDQIHLMELHPQEHEALKRAVHADNVHVHNRDGFEGVLALSPPQPRRGLVFIDPSYEIKAEYDAAVDFVRKLHRKWPEAVILLWYPVLDAGLHAGLAEKLDAAALPKYLRREIAFPNPPERGMRGSGLVLVNEPFGAAADLDAAEAYATRAS